MKNEREQVKQPGENVVISFEVFKKKLEERSLKREELPSDGEHLGKLLSMSEYKNVRAREWFIENFNLREDASNEDIALAMAKAYYRLPDDATEEDVRQAKLAAMDADFVEFNKQWIEGRDKKST
ncbi:MAG: hypothetical protein A3B31_00970 [Candidatus Komeilibacteria bacterium RIFCSPLOWO2_01_FULL_53_11]|uniref:Uncharacterized protein n=1 Tax=Candidatus Komeilibacteria bacterium RIFCSPLOWO2_01_FULL_53_11 TaxID=1798552 RepID=A0A1G2BU04_9BACT|nr:MAG: hypothetical protein A3B31_00970 [Candidatus Komeilibacteria bacterium RIFCSPLOWO2_01_FULL_53_11]